MEREFRPDGEQFTERSASDQAFAVGNPLDLARNIRALVQQERAYRSEDFNPASWLRTNIETMFHQVPGNEKEQQEFFYTLRAAWSLIAYEQLHGETSQSVYTDIRGYTHVFRSHTLTLNPLGVTLLDAMAEALDIPHIPGQAEFDISLFASTATMERIRQGLSRSPSVAEVRQTIASTQQ